MNNINELYNRWLAQPDLDDAVKAELVSIAGDSDAVTDRFYRDLEFGTGGLRGVIGAGTNRMNLYTVRKATQGLADYLNASGLPKKVAIAHDSRHNGALFARETARVLAANGITACMYPRLEPTPALSWAVRYLGCGAGVCVTASHNPAKYNGYKVYGADGCQITLEAAEKILAAIEKIDCFDDVRLADFDAAAAAGRIVTIDEKCLDDFVQAVYDQRVGDGAGIDALKLNGASDIAFVIGGSDGVSAAVRQRADETLSFGPVTLPHNLARVVLLEQLYRAQKISRGEPYHK